MNLCHVAHEVVFDFAWIDHLSTSALGRERRFEMLDPEAGQAVSVLDHDDRRRSLRSTTMIAAVWSERSLASLRRLPFISEPTSLTTSSTDKPDEVAHSVSLATLRSRSPRWSWLDTRA